MASLTSGSQVAPVASVTPEPTSARQTLTHIHVRRYRRVEPPLWGFVPWGLLPLLILLSVVLFSVTRFAQIWIEASVRDHVRASLQARGLSWASVEVSGQRVLLRGAQPREGDGERALQVAYETTCPTWAGERLCATEVSGEFTIAAVPPAQWPDYTFTLRDGVMTLRGIADEDSRGPVVQAAGALRAPPRLSRIEDQLTAARGPIRAGLRQALLRGVETLSRCKAGQATLSAATFSLRCELPAAKEGEVRALASAALPGGQIGEISLLVTEVADSCDRDFAQVLTRSTIQFAPGSADINPASLPVLQLVADIAKRCPGSLRVEGHTDTIGPDELNMRLSLERAGAVRAVLVGAGVAEVRLSAEGFGPTRPVADNASPEGRAKNRRIEVRIVR